MGGGRNPSILSGWTETCSPLGHLDSKGEGMRGMERGRDMREGRRRGVCDEGKEGGGMRYEGGKREVWNEGKGKERDIRELEKRCGEGKGNERVCGMRGRGRK